MNKAQTEFRKRLFEWDLFTTPNYRWAESIRKGRATETLVCRYAILLRTKRNSEASYG